MHRAPISMLLLPLGLALAACAAGGAHGTDSASSAGSASVSGAIQLGNQAPPALRVCAMPVVGGSSRCVDTAAGATSYRIDGLAAGDYHLMGWVQGGDLRLLAHANAIRCIRARRTRLQITPLQITRSVIAFSTARVRSRVPSLSRISDT